MRRTWEGLLIACVFVSLGSVATAQTVPPGGLAVLQPDTNFSVPVARDTSYISAEDALILGKLPARDAENNPLFYRVESGPSHGSVDLDTATGNFTYSPDYNYNGPDSLKFTARNSGFTSNVGTARFTITPVNDPPAVLSDTATTPEDMPVVINVLANDYDPESAIDPTTVVVVGGPSGPNHGSVGINPVTGEVTYTPAPNYFGNDQFAYRVKDDSGAISPPTLVKIKVLSINDPPVANDDSGIANEDHPVTVDVVINDTDLDGVIDPTSVVVTVGPPNGMTSVNPVTGAITYTPILHFTGTDAFFYTVEDDSSAVSNPGKVTITVNACGCACHGDPVCDGFRNILDVQETINEVFLGSSLVKGPTCPERARVDYNCDCIPDVLDVQYIIEHVFQAGPAPCDPCVFGSECPR